MFYLKSLTNNNVEILFKINVIVFKKKIFINNNLFVFVFLLNSIDYKRIFLACYTIRSAFQLTRLNVQTPLILSSPNIFLCSRSSDARRGKV